MNAAMEIQAATLAAKAGFGKARMMKLAEEVAGRTLKHLGELNDAEGERVMLLYAMLATPDGELERLKEVRAQVERVVPKEVRKRMQVEYKSADTSTQTQTPGMKAQNYKREAQGERESVRESVRGMRSRTA
jgi:hypothetical protein